MVLQARSKHRDAASRPPRPARASPPPLSGASEVGAGEPGPERAPPSPGRRGAAGRKGPRAETAAPAPDGLAGRLAAGLRWALGLRRGRGRTWSTLLLASFAALLHWSHITHLFENDRHFSHLSTLEREMAFRTEMGLYYSYFKTIVEAPSFLNGVWMIMNDKLTEYPLVINTLKRFNLYPEVILASWYRIYTKLMDLIGIQTKICWTVTRGEGLSPIESCEGLGDPACFYVAVIFMLNGLMMALFFIYGTYLSGSRLGGLVTVLCFFFNHGECTRVMWTPPLRESFSYPFLVLQMLLVTHILRATKLYRGSLIALCISNVFFMLPWQFAQFVLLTQTPLRYTKTLLLPLIIVITYFIFKKVVRDILCVLCTNTYLRKQLLDNGELIFHTLQLLAFTALAILIMRLKLFLTPHMCIMASLICSRRLFGWLFCRVHFENVVFGILTMMSIQGCANLHNQWSIMGEFTNLPQEELIHWIKYNTRADAVFAGAMPTMASIKLSTLHPIVNHPHYEDADLRARTKIVYSAYSRKSAAEVRDKLLELHVNYYVLEEAWCVVRTKPGCSMLEIWDVEDPSNAANPPLCSVLLKNAKPYFTTVFQNSMYRVLKIN